MRPVQLIPQADARPGATARHVPTWEPGPCDGCPQASVCRDRGKATVFLVKEVRGKPVWCPKIGANLVACKAQHMPEMEPRAEPQVRAKLPTLVCDASVFINAERWKWEQCRLVLERAGTHYRLATTRPVFKELHYAYKLPADLAILDVDLAKLHPRLLELARANRAYEDPHDEASLRDLSLVQALLDHKELDGILCEDDDLFQLHAPSVVRELAGRETLLMTCEQFCRSKRGLFPEYG